METLFVISRLIHLFERSQESLSIIANKSESKHCKYFFSLWHFKLFSVLWIGKGLGFREKTKSNYHDTPPCNKLPRVSTKEKKTPKKRKAQHTKGTMHYATTKASAATTTAIVSPCLLWLTTGPRGIICRCFLVGTRPCLVVGDLEVRVCVLGPEQLPKKKPRRLRAQSYHMGREDEGKAVRPRWPTTTTREGKSESTKK